MEEGLQLHIINFHTETSVEQIWHFGDNLLTGEGQGLGKEPRKLSLVLYISFNILWSHVYCMWLFVIILSI